MTIYHLVFVDYSKDESWDTTVRSAPDRESAIWGALEKLPNYRFGPIIATVEYVH